MVNMSASSAVDNEFLKVPVLVENSDVIGEQDVPCLSELDRHFLPFLLVHLKEANVCQL